MIEYRNSYKYQLFLGFIVLVCWHIYSMPSDATDYPLDAYPVTVTQKSNLQTILDQNKKIRLSPGDYRTNGVTSISLKSGYEIYGLPGVSLPKIIIAPGTENAKVSTVTADLEFNSSTAPIKHNVFVRIYGGLVVSNAIVEENLFLNMGGNNIDTRTSGYIRNNRFIRSLVHGWDPQIVVHGDSACNSYGNVFLFFNFLDPARPSSTQPFAQIDNQKSITFAGYDVEAYALGAPSSFRFGNMGLVKLFGGNGRAASTPYSYDIDAEECHVYGNIMNSSQVDSSPIILRHNNTKSIFINSIASRVVDSTSNSFNVNAFEEGTKQIKVNGNQYTALLPDAYQDSIRKIFSPAQNACVPWERPVFDSIENPLGADWRANLATAPDSSAMLQTLIDNSIGPAFLPKGFYYISKPLRIGRQKGLIGAGEGQTAIIAKDSSMDMFVGDSGANDKGGLTLGYLTVQGGRNGIHCEATSSGVRVQFVGIYLTRVTFRNMSRSGISIDKIYGLDNNFIDHVNFVDCGSGVLQTTDPAYTGGDTPTLCYIDKTMFYGCQFVHCDYAINLWANRANNLNAFVNCLFKENKTAALRLNNNLSTLVANCDFINNNGSSVIRNNYPVNFLSCYFKTTSATDAILETSCLVEGTVFEGRLSGSVVKSGSTYQTIFINSTVGMKIGELKDALFLNTSFSEDSIYNELCVVVKNGVAQTFVNGTPNPFPQILVGSDFQSGVGVQRNTSQNPTTVAEITVLPNPFSSGSVLIALSDFTGKGGEVKIFDIKGTLVARFSAAKTITWNCKNLKGFRIAPGVYFICLDKQDKTYVERKLIVIK